MLTFALALAALQPNLRCAPQWSADRSRVEVAWNGATHALPWSDGQIWCTDSGVAGRGSEFVWLASGARGSLPAGAVLAAGDTVFVLRGARLSAFRFRGGRARQAQRRAIAGEMYVSGARAVTVTNGSFDIAGSTRVRHSGNVVTVPGFTCAEGVCYRARRFDWAAPRGTRIEIPNLWLKRGAILSDGELQFATVTASEACAELVSFGGRTECSPQLPLRAVEKVVKRATPCP